MKLFVRKIILPYTVAICVALFFMNSGIAQQDHYPFTLVSNPDSIPFGKVTGIAQDPSGYMWFIDQGNSSLVRFDGYKMVKYRNDSYNPNSPGGLDLEALCADNEGKIWIGVGLGLDMLDPTTGLFTHYVHKDNDPTSFNGGYTHTILKDKSGWVWIGTDRGVERLDVKTGKFTHFLSDSNNTRSLSCSAVWTIYEDRRGDIWIGTGFPFNGKAHQEGGLNRFDPKTESFTRYLHDPANPRSLVNNSIGAIFEDSDGNFWVGTAGDGLHKMDRDKGTFERYVQGPNNTGKIARPPVNDQNYADFISFIRQDAVGRIWIGTIFSGLSCYDPRTQVSTYYKTDKSFPDGSAFCGFTSREGILWVASQWEAKLYRLDPFQTYVQFTPSTEDIHRIFQDKKGNLWLSKGRSVVEYPNGNPKESRTFPLPPDQSHMPVGQFVTNFLEVDSGAFWLSSSDGVFIFNPTTGAFTRFQHDPDSSRQFKNFISGIWPDSKGRRWILSAGGLSVFDPKTNTFQHFYNRDGDSTSLASDGLTTFLEDRAGNIWIGDYNFKGLNKGVHGNTSFKHYLVGQRTQIIMQDLAGTIWVGTQNGLFRYDSTADRFLTFNGSPADIENVSIEGIAEDEIRNLWVSTPSAIYRIDPAREGVVRFGKKFGVRPFSVGQAIVKTKDGQMFTGGNGGYYSFFPRDMEGNKIPSFVNITSFYVDNKLVVPGKGNLLDVPINDTKNVKLKYDQNNFGFQFVGIHFTFPEENELYFKLENYDNDWRKAGKENTVNYFKVPAGNYVFKVKCRNSNGIWSEKAVAIRVDGPWYFKWWSFTIGALLLFYAGFDTYRKQKMRIIQAEKQRTQARELAQAREIEKAYHELQTTQAQLIQSEKMASLGELTAGIAHEIQNPLNFVNNFAEVNMELIGEMKEALQQGNTGEAKDVADDIFKNLEKISHHGKRADGIVKGMLQHSRKSSGQKELTDINALVDEYLRLSYHGLRAKDKSFNAVFHTQLDPSVGNIMVVPQDIGRVFLNVYNNAFYAVQEKKKMTTEGHYEPTVWVTSRKLPGSVEISIKDNGAGIPPKVVDKIFQPFFTTKPTGEGTGLGLSMSYDIITKVHSGSLKLETKEGEGTTFVISLPA